LNSVLLINVAILEFNFWKDTSETMWYSTKFWMYVKQTMQKHTTAHVNNQQIYFLYSITYLACQRTKLSQQRFEQPGCKTKIIIILVTFMNFELKSLAMPKVPFEDGIGNSYQILFAHSFFCIARHLLQLPSILSNCWCPFVYLYDANLHLC